MDDPNKLRLRQGNFLDSAFQSLPEEQQAALMQKALEKKIDLEVEAAQADQRHSDFERESSESVRHLRELNNVRGVDIDAEFRGKTASGEWSVRAKKSNYTVIMVVAIVIGVLALVILNR